MEALHKVGPEMPERGSKMSMVPVIWATFGIFSARSKWFPVTIGDHEGNYDPETKQNQWSGSITAHPAPKNSDCKNPLEKFSPRFFGIKMVSSSSSSSKGPNCQHGVLFISAGAIEGHFEGKMLREGNQGGLVLARQCPGSTVTCDPKENGLPGLPVSRITQPILRIWPRRTTTCSLDWKNNWKVAIFHPMQRSLLPQRPGWTDNILNFFWVACKS